MKISHQIARWSFSAPKKLDIEGNPEQTLLQPSGLTIL